VQLLIPLDKIVTFATENQHNNCHSSSYGRNGSYPTKKSRLTDWLGFNGTFSTISLYCVFESYSSVKRL